MRIRFHTVHRYIHTYINSLFLIVISQFKIYPDIDSTVGEDIPVPAEIESEQEWLTSLYGFITQGGQNAVF